MFEPDETGRRPILDWTLKEWAAVAVVVPTLFAWSFFAFGGWLVLRESWSTIAAVTVYGSAVLFWLTARIAQRRSRS